jgi:hypothetical protein
MTKKRTLEELFSDPQMSERLKERLYSKKGLLGKESPFSEILQDMVDTMLDAEIDSFYQRSDQPVMLIKRNGKNSKLVIGEIGDLHVSTQWSF